MSSHPYVMDDPRLSEASGGSDPLRYPWMRHVPPPPAEGRVTPPKPMKSWAGQDATAVVSTTTSATSGRHDDHDVVIPRPFAFNTDVRKAELLNPFKDPPSNDNKPSSAAHCESPGSPTGSTAFEKGFVRELEKIDGITVKTSCDDIGSSGGGSDVIACLGGGLKPRINCEFCEQTFSRREGLKRHEITAHTDIRNYKCTECPQTFARKDKLKRHVETVHMTEKRFECETCGKGFNRKDKLQKHLHSDKAHVMAAALKPNTQNKATQEPPLSPEVENNLRRDFDTHRKLEEEERKKQHQIETSSQPSTQPHHNHNPTSSSITSSSSSTTNSASSAPHHQQHPHHPHHTNEYSDSARAFLESLSHRLNTDLPVFP